MHVPSKTSSSSIGSLACGVAVRPSMFWHLYDLIHMFCWSYRTASFVVVILKVWCFNLFVFFFVFFEVLNKMDSCDSGPFACFLLPFVVLFWDIFVVML